MTATAGRQQPAAGSRARYLDELCTVLWPPPAAVTVGSQASEGTDPAEEDYLVVPHARRPRLVVPRQGRAAAAAIEGFNVGRSRRARLLSGPLSLTLRAGAGGALLKDRLVVRDAADSLRRHLSDVLGQDVLMSFQIGPPRANRKPVVELVDHHGRRLGYAKLGVNELTRDLVRHEAGVLKRLHGTGTHAVTVPAVQYVGRWRDADVLLLRPLPAVRHHPHRPSGPRMRAAMTEVAAIAGLTLSPLAESQYWTDLRGGFAETGQPGEAFGDVLNRIGERLGETVLTFGSWHGDWTRSNVAPYRSTVLAWDWERFSTGVPVGFDALHHYLNHAIWTAHRAPELAARATLDRADDLLAPFGVRAGSAAARLTALLYVAELALRYLRDRQDAAGALLGEPQQWLLPALAAATVAPS
jgi:hypothetical protein